MITVVFNFLANKKWHEIHSFLPEIPLIGHCIYCRISDDIICTEWIVHEIIHHIQPDGTFIYVEVECRPK